MWTGIELAAKAAWAAAAGIRAAVWSWMRQPPGLYVVIALAAVLALWWFGQHEFSAGQAACEVAHKAATQAAIVRQERHATAVVAASEARTTADTKIVYRNREVIRYVTREAAKLPDGGDVCLTAVLADGVRGLQ
jgi:hypothetical protein